MKKDLLLLHGALGASVQFKELVALLENDFYCHLFDFPGHGSGEDTEEMSMELCAVALQTKVDDLDQPYVFGYSMGGYVALYLEAMQPGTFTAIVTLGTKFDWSPQIAEKEVGMLNPTKIAEKVPKFATYLETIQQPKDWKRVMLGTQGLMRRLGNQPLLTPEVLQKIDIPVTLTLGEGDVMVTPEETMQVHEKIATSDFRILPGVPHPIQQIDSVVLRNLLFSVLLNGRT